MKQRKDLFETMEHIVTNDNRYKIDAYSFVLEALNYTVSKLKMPRHVSGQELLEGIKRYTQEQFGPMARSVLEHWGLTSTEDFGHIVFNLVDAGLLRKTDNDSIDDFKNGYDFKETFDK